MTITLAASAMRRFTTMAAVSLFAAAPASLGAQRLQNAPGMTPSGPIIQTAGQSVEVLDPTFKAPAGHVFKAVWVIDRADTASVNQQLTTIARFLNLHARNGIPRERLHAAAVVHGTGWMSLLSDSAFGARFSGKANPSKRLVEELLANGVR